MRHFFFVSFLALLLGACRPPVGEPGAEVEATPLATFTDADTPITRDGVTTEEGGFRVAVSGPTSVRLFEVESPGVAGATLQYRAKLRTEGATDKVYLEMWLRFPDQGEFFSKGLASAVTGTTGWSSQEIPFFLQADQQPDLVRLNLAFDGTGVAWIKDIELRRAVLP